MTVTILLADDHPLIRQGLRTLLEAESGFSVVGEAKDGLQAVRLAESLQPSILIVDLMMPNLNGLEVLKQVRHRSPNTHMIVLSMQSAEPYVVETFRSGAIGYVLKDSAPGELITAIRQALVNEKYLSPKLREPLIDMIAKVGENVNMDPYETLTDREREVLQMAAEGKTAPEIARQLSISHRTVELHRSRMMNKMGFRTQTELVRYAIKRGILPMED
ncbi:MAG TPA: response regulator transcription factor [Anaerolineales bacterium]|nr:response regulator transcription factor [Anaerolineales bacterium]